MEIVPSEGGGCELKLIDEPALGLNQGGASDAGRAGGYDTVGGEQVSKFHIQERNLQRGLILIQRSVCGHYIECTVDLDVFHRL